MLILSSYLKEIRRERNRNLKKRGSRASKLIFALILWLILMLIIFFADPEKRGAIEIFMITLFFAVFFTSSLFFKSTRRSIFITIAINSFILLKYLGVGSILNLLLIIGIVIVFEFYLSKSYK